MIFRYALIIMQHFFFQLQFQFPFAGALLYGLFLIFFITRQVQMRKDPPTVVTVTVAGLAAASRYSEWKGFF